MSLTAFLSPTRLAAFRLTPQDTDDLILARYLWNLELSSALYVPLHVVEVGLRNALDGAISANFGSDWLTTPGILAQREEESVKKALAVITKPGAPLNKGKLIAELMFGFWVGLFYRVYEVGSQPSRNVTPSNAFFWPICIKSVFPHAPKSMQTRTVMASRLEEIKKLRNRVFHHEPIWKNPRLPKIHQEMCEIISWISPDVDPLLANNRVASVLQLRP